MTPVDQKPTTGHDSSTPEPNEKALKRNREGTVLALLFAAALLASTYPLPFSLVAGLFAILTLVWAVRFFIAAVAAKSAGNWVILGAVAALGSVYILLSTVGTAAIWPVQQTFEECRSQAITEQAAIHCTTEYNDGLRSFLDGITGQ